MLGVPDDTLAAHGAVSQPVAVAMAEGALRHSRANWALAITGIAGPDGGTAEKPVGTVCFAWAARGGGTTTETRHFAGDRETVRARSVARALEGLLERLAPPEGWVA
jgi:nicotinamide-nucleotide amidase